MTAKTLSLLAIALSATPAMASGICGSIGKVDVPSYRFKVIAADGSAAPQFNVTGALTTVEGVWEVSHWGSTNHELPIAISYDSASGEYVSKATEIKPATRWKSLDPVCKDQVVSMTFSFNSAPKNSAGFSKEWDQASFSYAFPETGSSFTLPSAESAIGVKTSRLTAMTGLFMTDTEFMPTGAETTVHTTWESTSSVNPYGPGLDASEMALINSSILGRAPVTIYGKAMTAELPGEPSFRIINIQPAPMRD